VTSSITCPTQLWLLLPVDGSPLADHVQHSARANVQLAAGDINVQLAAGGIIQQPTPQPAALSDQRADRQLVASAQVASPVAAGSPFTPSASRAGPLDLRDPYTPWLRTSSKPPRPTPGATGLLPAADQQDGSLLGSPVSISTASSSGSRGSPVHRAVADASQALTGLCAAVAELQLQQGTTGGTGSSFDAEAAAGSRSEGDDAAAAEFSLTTLQLQHTPQMVHNGFLGSTAAAQSEDDEDDAAPLTLGRRTQPRVYRRPLLTPDTGSSSSSSSSGSDREDAAGSSGMQGGGNAHAGSCCVSGVTRRITPGSTSSLVSRRRPSSDKQRHTGPMDTGYTGAYDFDMHLSTVKPAGWQLQRRQQHLERGSMTDAAVGRSSFARSPSSPHSASPRSPVAALSFTPGLHGAAAVSPGPSMQGAARRLSQSFLGSCLPVSPPVLKLQGLQATPAAGQRGVHSAQPGAQAAATTGKGRMGQFGTQLWKPDDSSTPNNNSSSSSSMAQPGDFIPSSRRPKDPSAAGAAARIPAATAPAKAPSSRTFARQRQQLAQDLYAQWNAQVRLAALIQGIARPNAAENLGRAV